MATSKKTGKVNPRRTPAKKTKEQRLEALRLTSRVTYHHIHNVVPHIVAKLEKATSRDRFVSGTEIINSLYKNHGIKLQSSVFRGIMHYIRVKGIVKCMVATSQGYYVTKDTAEVLEYIKSLRKRIRQIGALAIAIDRQSHEVIGRQYAAIKSKPKTKNHPSSILKSRKRQKQNGKKSRK